MTADGFAFVCLVIAGLSLFAGVLGWASWAESRQAQEKARK